MAKNCFSIFDIIIVLVSLVTFILDVGTDICVCIGLLLDGQIVWGWLMVVFMAVPAVLMNAFSLIWHIHDRTVTPVVVVIHLLLVSPPERYLRVVCFGIHSYRTKKVVFTQQAERSLSDMSLLRLIQAFLESAPQLILQLYILLCKQRGSWLTGMSVGCSLVSLTWAVTTYCDTQCRGRSISFCQRFLRLLLHWGWQLFMSSARIAAFVLFACALQSWVFAVMGGHWLTAFLWISVRGTDFGIGYEKWLFRVVCAFIYIFAFLNLNEGKSRWRITAYYLFMLLENTGMLVVFLVMGDSQMILVSCLVVYAGFFIGLICMLVYYAFLHHSGSSKRFFLPHLRPFNISGSSHGTDPQIFSIESPKQVTSIEGTSIRANLASNNSQNSVMIQHQSCHSGESSGSLQQSDKAVNSTKQILQMAWQNGMQSSGSSSCSLASTGNPSCLVKRTSSIKSDNSHSSASSANHLLPQLLANNSPSKSPKKNVKTEETQVDYVKQVLPEIISESDNLNLHSGGSQSSTDSWTRLSDQNMQRLVLADFTVLGIDESSSTDKRVSGSSSLSSQQKSLSSLDASNLWKDAYVRLRATIAATIAAATGNPSSNEGTPTRSQSISSYNSTVSGQDESLNSTHNVTTLSHNTAFVDSGSSFKEKCNISQQNDVQDSSHHRESLCTLPDIIETFDQEELSDFESLENSYKKSAGEAMGNKLTEMSAEVWNDCSSPYLLDSTLTVSKLEIKKPNSYLASQRMKDSDCQSALASESSCNLSILPFRTPIQNPLSRPTSGNKETIKGDSPFTDQELVTVMAKSLQNYIDGSVASDSNVPEREGLALTLEDLRLSPESTPEPSPSPHKTGGAWKSRSASSLFHDSPCSSPESSASKMNQLVSIQNAEAKLSPNALKQIEDLPQRLHGLYDLHYPTRPGQTVTTIPHSNALKFIMDSYESTALINPCVTTPISHKSLSYISTKSMVESKLLRQPLSHSKREISDFPSSSRTRAGNILLREGIAKDLFPVQTNICHKDFHLKESLHTSAWKRSKVTSPSLEVSGKTKDLQTRGGMSSTKKLNVHFNGLSGLDYNRSPVCNQSQKNKESDSGSEMVGYVSGQYCPPLCGNNAMASADISIQRSLDYEKRDSRSDLHRVSKSVPELFCQEKKQSLATTDLHILAYPSKDMPRKDFENERPNLSFLKQSKSTPLCHRLQPSKPHPYGQHQSPMYQNEATNKSMKISSQSLNKNLGNMLSESHDMDELSDDQLQLSARHVAEYFSEALDIKSSSPGCGTRSKKLNSQQQLQVHGYRQPLQRLENSQHISPGTSNYNVDTRFYVSNDSNNCTPNRRHQETTKYTITTEDYKRRSSGEHYRQHLMQYAKDFPKVTLPFDSSEATRIHSRPPLRESSRVASRLILSRPDKSSTKVQLPADEGMDKYFMQSQHSLMKDKSNNFK